MRPETAGVDRLRDARHIMRAGTTARNIGYSSPAPNFGCFPCCFDRSYRLLSLLPVSFDRSMRANKIPAADVIQGTLDLLVLKALVRAPMHGWGIGARIKELSDEAFELGQGSLYPALHRLEKRGWITSIWRQTEKNRIARFYELTPKGRQALQDRIKRWRAYASAIDLVIGAD